MPFSGASFVYDGDGNRVAQTVSGVTSYFVGTYSYLLGGGILTPRSLDQRSPLFGSEKTFGHISVEPGKTHAERGNLLPASLPILHTGSSLSWHFLSGRQLVFAVAK